MDEYQTLSPGSKAGLLVATAYYLRSLASFYANPLHKHPQELKDKYTKLPFLEHISEKLIQESERLKLEDYSHENNDVLNNDFLRICFGYHKDLFDMLLLKSSLLWFGNDVRSTTHNEFFKLHQDPSTALPASIALFLQQHFNPTDADTSYKAFEKLAVAFLLEYSNANELFTQTKQEAVNPNTLIMMWRKFSQIQIHSYDAERVAEVVEQARVKGNTYYKEKRYAEAITSYTEGLQANPNSYQLLCNRSAIYTVLNFGEAALADTQKAVELHPSSISAWARLAFNHLYCGYAVESFKDYNNAILAAHGLLYPLNLINGPEELKRQFTERASKQAHKKFVSKLCSGMKFARGRGETQGYPSQYFDDLMHPLVKEVWKENLTQLEQTAVDANATNSVGATQQPTIRTGVPPVTIPAPPTGTTDFQSLFSTLQQAFGAQEVGAANFGGDPNPATGLSLIGNIISSFANGALRNSAPPTAQGPATATTATSTTTAPFDNTQSNNEPAVPVAGNAEDADPDIELEDIVEDAAPNPAALPSGTRVAHTPGVTIVSGSLDGNPELRDQMNRMTGGLFGFFTDNNRATNQRDQTSNPNEPSDNVGGDLGDHASDLD